MNPTHFYPLPGAVTPTAIRPGATAVLLNAHDQILLHKRSDNGFWSLPGGAIEPGESAAAAVIREVKEETGYDARIERLLGVYTDPANRQIVRYPDGNIVHYIVIAFVCRVTGGDPTLCDETLDLRWSTLDDLPEPLVPAHALRLADFAASPPQVFAR